MDEETENLLKQWGLADYIDTFKENKIDIKVLPILDSTMIKDLITPMGDRARFFNALNLWKAISNDIDEDIEDRVPPLAPQDVEDEEVISEKSIGVKDVTNELSSEQTIIVINKPLDEVTNYFDSPSCSNHASNTTRVSLLNLLNKSTKGKTLLKLHKEEGVLSSSSRRNICNIIVEDLLSEDPNVRVNHDTLLSIAEEIKNIFPKESISTYYVPYVNNNKIKVKTCAKGKLYDCLHNRKRQYREAEKKNNSLKAEQATQEPDGKQNLQYENDTPGDDVQQHLIWLRNSIEPWQLVQKKWQETAAYRLKNTNNEKTFTQYMNEFPALKSPAGYTLFVEDFKTLYPDKENLLLENFCLFKDKILNYVKQKATRDESLQKIIEELENLSDGIDDIRTTEAKTILAFMALPLVLGNPLAKVKKNSWRPSKKESSEGFIAHIVTAGEVQTTISSRREKFSKLNVTLQPFIMIVGCNYTDIEKYYVVINDTLYVVHSIVNAVDVCFKIFHALNCKYPIECSSTWQFIQKGLYNLQTPYDKQYVSVNSLISDLGIKVE